MSRLTVEAHDPGITTGIATGFIRPDEPMEVGSMELRFSVGAMYDHLERVLPDIIIYESFEFRNAARKGLELFSRELIGIYKLYADKHPDTIIYKQSPYQGVGGYFTNKQLKENNVYKPGMGHAMDATRHLLQWYTFGPGYRYNTKGFGPA